MEVFRCIRTRRTVRDFTPDPVPDAVIHKIIQAARWAPSSSNTQPWHFIVVRERDTIAALGRICTQGAFIGAAPLAIAIAMEVERSSVSMSVADITPTTLYQHAIAMEWALRPHLLDAGRALQQMELVAWDEGLGTCFVGIRGEQQREVETLLGIPDDLELVTVLPFGYRIARPPGAGTPRKPLLEIAHGERFGQSLSLG